MNRMQITQPLISIVIPAHNEAEGIRDSVNTIIDIVRAAEKNWEIIVVDDGSRDGTFAQVYELSSDDSRIKALRFSRNFGKESALLAGLEMATGDAVITIDADLQHPPRLIPEMIEKFGYTFTMNITIVLYIISAVTYYGFFKKAEKKNEDSPGWTIIREDAV